MAEEEDGAHGVGDFDVSSDDDGLLEGASDSNGIQRAAGAMLDEAVAAGSVCGVEDAVLLLRNFLAGLYACMHVCIRIYTNLCLL